MRELLKTLQHSMVVAAMRDREVVDIGPFRAMFSPTTDMVWLNYAVPIEYEEQEYPLEQLKTEFRKRNRRPRFEFLAELTPALPSALERAGFELQGKMPLMVCTRENFLPRPDSDRAEMLGPSDDPRGYIKAGAEAFGDDSGIDESRIERHRKLMREGHFLCSQLREGDRVVSVACIVPAAGAAELAGVGTVPEYRRRGYASITSSLLLERLFSNEDTQDMIAWLSAGSEEAAAVYERLGFQQIGFQMNYIV